jgi:ABC-type multidrug transport system fused ATPase/permease subunit
MVNKKFYLKFYLDILKGFYSHITFLLFSIVIVGFLSAYTIVFIKKTIDAAVSGKPIKIIIYFGLIYFLLHIFNAFLGRWFEYYSNYVSNLVSHSLRCKIFDHLMRLKMKYYDSGGKSIFLFNFIEDNNIVASSFLQPLSFIGRSVFTFIFGFYYMWNIDKVITLILLPIGILVTSTVIFSRKRIEKNQYELLSSQEELWQKFSEFINGMKDVKGNCKEDFAFVQIQKCSDRLKESDIHSYEFQSLTQGINQFFFMGIIAFIMVYGAVRVKLGFLSIGGLSSIMMYNGLLVDPMIEFFSLYQQMKRQFVNIKRIANIFSYETEDSILGVEFSGFKDMIIFKDITFTYPNSSYKVINELNLVIKRGEKIALIGKSGQGKTTIIKLLHRFYDPDKGKIIIDGKDIKEYSLQSLRKKIGVVYQDFFLFRGSILDNIRFGNYNATEKQINEIIKICGLEDMIKQLPNGLLTDTGENGVKISAGEKQRIGITRALLRDVDIIILDEAVANLDSIITSDILQNICKKFPDKTMIFIMHKLTTIINMPRIVLLDGGKILADGTHNELLSQNQLYREMYEKQFSTFEILSNIEEK